MPGHEIEYMSIADMSTRYAISENEIRGNIHAGHLAATAYYGLKSRGGRPKYLIKKSAADEFMQFKMEEGERRMRDAMRAA